ncbi:restriction endonuclease [Puniceicoccaceae bacterium K14]|nr:restriction endonuclease [Puniceicoccaceae bacterium K14]
MIGPNKNVAEFAPEGFEKHVQNMIELSGIDLSDFRTSRRENIKGLEGEYEIDVVARFSALGTSFLVLIECKHHKSPIKRDVVQVLRDRMRSVGAQKGMIFSTAKFQSGALKYAKAHGIALVQVTDSEPIVYNRAEPVMQRDIATREGAWIVQFIEEGKTQYTSLGLFEPRTLFKVFGINVECDLKNSEPIEISITRES